MGYIYIFVVSGELFFFYLDEIDLSIKLTCAVNKQVHLINQKEKKYQKLKKNPNLG